MWGLGSPIPPILFQFPAFPSSPLDSSGGPLGAGKAGLQFWKPAAALCCSPPVDPRAAVGVGPPGVLAVARGDFRQGLSSQEGRELI